MPSEAPKVCIYCRGSGNSPAGGDCGFCDNGIPLDTQEDWDATWGRVFDHAAYPIPRYNPECEEDHNV